MIIKCIKEMELGELAGFLRDGGFCPEKYDASLEDGEVMKPFFGCEMGVGSVLCRECIEEFLQEENDDGAALTLAKDEGVM